VKALPLLPATATPLEKAKRAGEALLARADLIGTLRSLARLREKRLGDHKGAAAGVAQLREDLPASCPGWVEMAALLCRCIHLAEEDDKLDSEAKSQAVAEYGQAALSLLDGLAAAPPPELAAALEDFRQDFAPLRTLPAFREDFRRLV